MDNVIEFFLDSGYTEELRDQIRRAFKLLEEFNFPQLYESYHDILGEDQLVYNTDLRDRFAYQVQKDLRHICSIHSVVFIDDIKLQTLVDLTEFFMTIQHLVDYDMILSTMESSEMTDEEQLVEIMNEYTGIDHSLLTEYIQSFDSKFLEFLKLYALTKSNLSIPEESKEVIELKASMLANIKLYKEHIDSEAVGVALVELGVLLNQPFQIYYNLVADDLSEKKPQALASDIISLSIISDQKDASAMDNFRAIASRMNLTIPQITTTEQFISSLYSAYNGLVKAA